MSISTPHRVTNGAPPTSAGLSQGLPQYVQDFYSVFDAAMPFGGLKESGWGREMGHNALDNYLQTKSGVTRLA